MDEQLAAIYGTGQQEVEEDDLEKTAAAELLVKLAEEQDVNLEDFSDEEIGEMLSELYEGGIEHTAEAEEEIDEESQEKLAEADYLGRVMAHAMVQELDNIEKDAGKVTETAGKVGDWFKRQGEGRMKAYKKGGEKFRQAFTGKKKGLHDPLKPKTRLRNFGEGAAKFAPEAGVAAGLTGGGVGAAKLLGKKKESSALETLAEERAYELAAEAGYIKEASGLDYEVERRALEICEENGIPVEWNE